MAPRPALFGSAYGKGSATENDFAGPRPAFAVSVGVGAEDAGHGHAAIPAERRRGVRLRTRRRPAARRNRRSTGTLRRRRVRRSEPPEYGRAPALPRRRQARPDRRRLP